jgi:hypothetical protein
MTDEKNEDQKPKRSSRFVYSEEDVAHIFGLGKTGGVFKEETKEERVSSLLKKIQEIKKNLSE